MPLAQTSWDEIGEYIGYIAEDAGLVNPSVEECLECMRLNWSTVIDPVAVNTYVVAKRAAKKAATIVELAAKLAELEA